MGHKGPLPTQGASQPVVTHPLRRPDSPNRMISSSKKAGAANAGFFAAEAPPPAGGHQVPLMPTGRRPNRAAAPKRAASPTGLAPALCPSYQIAIGWCWSFFDNHTLHVTNDGRTNTSPGGRLTRHIIA